MKSYTITTDNGLPTAKIHNFQDEIEAGIVVVELTNGVYYIEKSNFIAKTLRQWDLGIYGKDYLHKNPPIKFVEKYLLNTSRAYVRGGSPELRVAMQKSESNMHDAIYYNYLEKYGHSKVKSSHWLQYGQKGFESKSEYVDSWIHQVNYSKILIGDRANGKKRKSA
jgi:hypothetical protein